MSYGAVIKASNGSVLASAEAKAYALYENVYGYTVEKNEKVFFSSCPTYPLIFLVPNWNTAAGVLSVEQTVSGWTIRVLSGEYCYLKIFRPIPDGRGSGFGVEFFSASGARTYSTTLSLANPRKISVFNVGSTVAITEPKSISYYATPVKYTQSTQDRPEPAGIYYSNEYIPTLQYVCSPVSVFVCGPQTVLNFQCGVDASGMYFCAPVYVTEYSCWFETQTQCSYQYVYTWELVAHAVTAIVRRTFWAVERGGAHRAANAVSFAWILHDNGFYDEVIGGYDETSSVFTGAQVLSLFTLAELAFLEYDGAFDATNRFPYTTSSSVNQVNATIAVE